MNKYVPHPIDVSDVVLPEEMITLTEQVAENVHNVWAKGRIAEGWKYGNIRNEIKKTTPHLVSYKDLPEEEKEYDRRTALDTLKLIKKLGYDIVPNA